MTQTLQLPTGINALGSYGASVSIQFDEIRREFGSGNDATEMVGHTDGQIILKLNYDFLPDEGSLTVLDPENSNAVTYWPRYLWKFFIRRKRDQEAFNVTFTDPGTGADSTLLFKFADSQLDYQMATFKLYSTGLVLRQWRART